MYKMPKTKPKNVLTKKQYNFCFGNAHKRTYASSKEYLGIKEFAKKVCKNDEFLELESQMYCTTTEYISYASEATTFTVPDGSHLRFKTRAKSIDLSRVWVNPDNHGKGIGTFLMDTFLFCVYQYVKDKNDFPKIILECTGAVGLGQNLQRTSVSKQMKFFKKFGFEFVREDSHGYYHMELTEEGFINWIREYSKNLAEQKEITTLAP